MKAIEDTRVRGHENDIRVRVLAWGTCVRGAAGSAGCGKDEVMKCVDGVDGEGLQISAPVASVSQTTQAGETGRRNSACRHSYFVSLST